MYSTSYRLTTAAEGRGGVVHLAPIHGLLQSKIETVFRNPFQL